MNEEQFEIIGTKLIVYSQFLHLQNPYSPNMIWAFTLNKKKKEVIDEK